MQLRITWEEILKRFDNIEVLKQPERVHSNFVNGYVNMQVKVIPKAS
jgi:cytochrome P450